MFSIASFACNTDNQSVKRQFIETEQDSLRSPFQVDYDRLIHSTSFRRLEYKTQVFVNHEGDHYRTRLTHTLEVVSVARILSRLLNLNQDLTETLALAHDLGHPPFGHAGEDALNEKMSMFDGFDHNVHTIKIITTLEKQYKDFDGLNLSWHTIEGIAKHNGPIIGDRRDKCRYNGTLNTFMKHINDSFDLKLDNFPSLEAQIASLSDDIAYNNHDIDDGIRAGLFTFNDIAELPLFGDQFKETLAEFPDIDSSRLCRESIRKIMRLQIEDLVNQTQKNLHHYKIETIENIYDAPIAIADFSPTMKQYNSILKKFLVEHMYTHKYVYDTIKSAKIIIHDLFDTLYQYPENMPDRWLARITPGNDSRKAEIVADYIAGMTDRYAIKKHRKLCGNDIIC